MTAQASRALVLALAVAFAAGGCASRRVVHLDAQNPAVRCSTSGIYFGDDRVEVGEVPGILEDYDIPHDRVIHIRLDPGVTDLREARMLMVNLARNGYTRPVLVTERHAESVNVGRKKKPQR